MEQKSYPLIAKHQMPRISFASLILGVACSFLVVYIYESIWGDGEIEYTNISISVATFWLVYGVLSWLNLLSNKLMVEIDVNDELLTIKTNESVLWSKEISKIASIEIKRSQRLFSFARRAILFRCIDDDSYYMPLDNLDFKNRDDEHALINLIKTI